MRLEAGRRRHRGKRRLSEALVAELAARPDDVELARVYADWLLQQGHPVGELASVQLQRLVGDAPALAAREVELTEQHVLPFMRTALARDYSTTFRWRNGMLDILHVMHHGGEDDLVDTFARLAADPAGRFVRRIEIDAVAFDGKGDLAPVFAQLAALAPRFVRLAELAVAEGANVGNPWIDGPIHIGDVTPIYAAYPRLAVLALAGKDYALGTLELPALRRLALLDLSPDDIAAVARASLPMLAELELTFGRWRVDDLDAMFHPLFARVMPTLTTLSISSAIPRVMQYLVRAVPGAELARRVRVLAFRHGVLDADCVRALVQWVPRLRALERLEVEGRGLDPYSHDTLAFAFGKILAVR